MLRTFSRSRLLLALLLLIMVTAGLFLLGERGVWATAAGGAPGDGSGTLGGSPQASAEYDVVVYSTQTSGLAAVRELVLAAPKLRVALVSSGNLLETPLAQGLSVEDARNIDDVKGGFYAEWRGGVINAYRSKGIRPFNSSGRFVYEPDVSARVLWQFARGAYSGGTTFYSARLVDAGDRGETRYVDIQVEGGGIVRLNTRYFIDASVEGDLARMLGADYRVGRSEEVYNDVDGRRPDRPSSANDFVTAPQRFSALLTLKVYPNGGAPRVSLLSHPSYDPSSYQSLPPLSASNVSSFGASWSMKIATLPNAKRELNERWTDWPDVGLAFDWIFSPEKRGDIRRRVLEWSINRVRYLQEHGYAKIGIAAIPQKLYVREGPRVVGLDTYTVDDLRTGAGRDPVALGCYVEYDRHDAFYPNHVEQTRVAQLPMEALMAQGHPWLLVSTAVSTDYAAYSSAVRMEHMRAHMGGAAGALIATAERLGIGLPEVPYSAVRSELLSRGYRLEPGD
ncbi:MAG: FAD-dependent oxidoreductase [Actinobacteria bacterium]|nr:FAD-dependent oxidoreductase [Actinomycetota bacterium]